MADICWVSARDDRHMYQPVVADMGLQPVVADRGRQPVVADR